ncbi:hypothetical protein KEJ50_01330 [Candidatus Bathyarchaeota archaeon]|nr:hypothetical protein [Candidatus Bathyarchaeota archaeon]
MKHRAYRYKKILIGITLETNNCFLKLFMLNFHLQFFNAYKTEKLIFYGGNRDHSWQGLIIGPFNNTLYKLIDGIYYSIGEPLKAEKVFQA